MEDKQVKILLKNLRKHGALNAFGEIISNIINDYNGDSDTIIVLKIENFLRENNIYFPGKGIDVIIDQPILSTEKLSIVECLSKYGSTLTLEQKKEIIDSEIRNPDQISLLDSIEEIEKETSTRIDNILEEVEEEIEESPFKGDDSIINEKSDYYGKEEDISMEEIDKSEFIGGPEIDFNL